MIVFRTQASRRFQARPQRCPGGLCLFGLAVVFCWILAEFPVWGQGETEALSSLATDVPPHPRIYVAERVFDFGVRPNGVPVEHDFVIENRGTLPLTIQRVRTSCGCTVGQMTPSAVPAGTQGLLHVRFDTHNRTGRQSKSIYVLSNDPDNPNVVCRLEGTLEQMPQKGSVAETRSTSGTREEEAETTVSSSVSAADSDGGALSPKPEVSTRPRLVLPETSWQAGSVRRGTLVEHDFQLKNAGDASLLITRIRSSCGCMSAHVSSELIGPGEAASLHVVFDTKGRQGTQRMTVDLFSNDPDGRSSQVTLSAEVYSPVHTDTSVLYFLDVPMGETAKHTVRLLNDENGPVEVRNLKCTLPFVEVTASPNTSVANMIEIGVTLKTDAPVGSFAGYVTMETNDTKDPERSIRISGRVRGDVAVSPSRLQVTRDSRFPAAVNLRRDLCKRFEVLSTEAREGKVHVRIQTIKEGEAYRIDVIPSDSSTTGRTSSDLILIHTDCERQPLIEIPIVVKG